MEINFDTLAYYCDKKNQYYITFAINTDDKTPCITAIAGKGDRKEFFDFKDFSDLLILNNIIGTGSLVEKELATISRDKDVSIEFLIYDTIAKYIINLFVASGRGEKNFEGIKHLEKHSDYFKR